MSYTIQILKKKRFGLPQSIREGFELLLTNSIIDAQLGQSMKAIIGFRNIAVHNYSNLSTLCIKIVVAIIEKQLNDFFSPKLYFAKVNKAKTPDLQSL